MAKVTVAENRVLVGDQRITLLSGEVHYWRLNPFWWERILDRVAEMGLKVVATYVPWEYHEYERGKFDFSGQTEPQRNLVGFLQLLQQKGFYAIIRPGPFIYSEWVNAGVPDYAAQYHRLHPKFRELAAPYIQEVSRVLLPFLATRNGPIVLCQVDNELDPWVISYQSQLGMDGKGGLFADYLEEKYGSIEKLNQSWGTHYSSFSEVHAFLSPTLDDPSYVRRFIDSRLFHWWYGNKYATWVAEEYRKNGVDVPLILNTYSSVAVQNWREFQELVDIVGIDIYPTQEFRYREDEFRRFLEVMRLTRSLTRLPFIMEFESGVWHSRHYDTGVLTANHYRLLAFSALLGGVAGWNWYMLVNRDNWYMCPINEWGRKRPELFEAFEQIVSTFNRVCPPDWQKLTETAVTIYLAHHATGLLSPKDPVLTALHEADIDYEFFDVESGRIPGRILFYSGCSWLPWEAHMQLVNYVEKGGILVVFLDYPRLDEDFRPLNLLEIPDPEGIGPEELRPSRWYRVNLGDTQACSYGSAHFYERVPGTPLRATIVPVHPSYQEESDKVLSHDAGREVTVGYVQSRGKGKIMVLGLRPTPELLRAIHGYFGIPVYAISEIPVVKTALFRRDNRFYLVVVNNGEEDLTASIRIAHPDLPRKARAWDVRADRALPLLPQQDQIVSLHVPIGRKDGTIVEIA